MTTTFAATDAKALTILRTVLQKNTSKRDFNENDDTPNDKTKSVAPH